MIDTRRLAAVVIMLLSQVAGGLVVICDEDLGGPIMEIFPQSCCETSAEAGSSPATDSSAGEQDQDPCGPCLDLPLVQFLQTEDEYQCLAQSSMALVTALPDAALTQIQPPSWGVIERDLTSHKDSSTTLAQLAGTVVLLC